MRFWDSSAIIPLLTEEPSSAQMLRLMGDDRNVVVSFLTEVEVASGLARRRATLQAKREALDLFESLHAIWTRIDEYEQVLKLSREVIRKYSLRAGDAIQLASALIACRRDTAALPFVTNDIELKAAARAEGFPILP